MLPLRGSVPNSPRNITWGGSNYSISHIIKRQFPSIRSNSRVCVRDVCKGPETVIWLMGINQVETSDSTGEIV